MCCGLYKSSLIWLQAGAGRVGSCRSMLSSWRQVPALSIRLVWDSNPRPLINVADVVVGSIRSFLWSHDRSDSKSLRNDAGSLSGAVKVY